MSDALAAKFCYQTGFARGRLTMRFVLVGLLVGWGISGPGAAADAEKAAVVPVREVIVAGGALATCADTSPRACATPPEGGISSPGAAADAEQAAVAPVRELILAGGALAMCADTSARACATPPEGARPATRYRLDEAALLRALEPALWTASGAPSVDAVAALLGAARVALGARAEASEGIDAATLEGALAAVCPTAPCAAQSFPAPWSMLLDAERGALLAALELPTVAADAGRVRERAYPARSKVAGGVRVLVAFVAAAKVRSAGRPRIAVVTASAFDSMEPVDFYLSLFAALDADVVWWPVDAAVAAARFEAQDCDALPRLRLERLQLSQRERIYPDLAAEQERFCRMQPTSMPQVDGVFFGGGDQWRLRQAFVDAEGRPNAWLIALQRAHAAGRVVVGGTSAGAAVQSGSWMLSNGSVEAAVRGSIQQALPPEPGCARGDRCGGVAEDQLTLWADGGLRLAEGAIVDTHFSERARELRLLLAMQAADARWGYGADETSALVLREFADRREISAVGEHGGWVLHRPAGQRDAALAWYLVPGATLVIAGDEVRLALDEKVGRAKRPPRQPVANAFEAGALRSLAQRLAWRCGDGLSLPAGTARAELRCLPGHRSWSTAGGLNGVGPLALVLRVGATHPTGHGP